MKKFLTKLFGARGRTRASSGASFRPRLEGLEGRALPSSLAPVSQPTVQVVTAQVSQPTVLATQSQLQNYSVQLNPGAAVNQPVKLASAPSTLVAPWQEVQLVLPQVRLQTVSANPVQVSQQTVLATQSQLQNYSVQLSPSAAVNQPVNLAHAPTGTNPTQGPATPLPPAQSQLLVMFPPITSLFAW
jgi:hypothetical protein